ncbi:hypothetical protein [uncultured Campylobacter sp.]|uniref:hypothetical protein n=1 Tax=uncultured Campylobacter sp. TaxID=218934 RepID=UPI00261873CD|nr:hypothetical protein [uncultured Campylobacter sp.]
MRIFGKTPKSCPQNSELRGHCGADSCVMLVSLAQTRLREISKKAAKGAGVKEQILLNLEHILHRSVRFIRPLRAQLACKTAPAPRNL